jgi:tetratricopeptide (TPR) repeat protein
VAYNDVGRRWTSSAYTTTAEAWWAKAEAEGIAPRLEADAANDRAWSLLGQGRAREGVPFARMAVQAEPASASYLDTLGQILVALRESEEAEAILRKALEYDDRDGTRVALARALAALSKYTEAVREASTVLARHRGKWRTDEPGEIEIRTWVEEWQRKQAPTPASRPGILPGNVGTI